MIQIFIGLSQNQINSYQNLLPLLETSKNVLITSNTLQANTTLFDEVIYTEKSFNNQSTGILNSIKSIISKVKEYKKIVKQLTPYKKSKEVRLYFTYIEDVLTNYLLFSFNENIEGIVVEDGTLNYYLHTLESLSIKKVYLKKMISDMYGLPFTLYKGHSSGIEYEHVAKQFVRVPELSLFPEKSEQLPYELRTGNITKSVLIIGQEAYINQFGKELYYQNLTELLEAVKNATKNDFIERIYYKPHRNGERIDYTILNTFFSKEKVTILEADIPLEDLYFNQLVSKYIFAFDSSALLNIYLEAEEALRKQLKFTVILKYNTLLKDIFKKFKFTIIE